MARTQINKATMSHICLLRARLVKLRGMVEEAAKKQGGGGEGFDVMKSGDGRVAMVGFPSVGKSSFLNLVTGTESLAAAYAFTTLTCIPGVINYNDTKIQLLDLPGIIEGASKGKGRGRQVIGVARTADLILMMLDAEKAAIQRVLLTRELEAVGIRLNKKPANISFTRKAGGGISFISMVPDLKELSEDLCRKILSVFRIHNAEILIREDCTAEEFIDVVEGNRIYTRCLYVCNKVDNIYLDQVDRLAHMPDTVVISVQHKLNIDYLLKKMWEYLQLLRIYTKPRGERPDFSAPVILRSGATIEHVCHTVHRDFARNFKYALVWGQSAKHAPQRVGLAHSVADEDVVQLMSR
jgi:small GTP-binding protein